MVALVYLLKLIVLILTDILMVELVVLRLQIRVLVMLWETNCLLQPEVVMLGLLLLKLMVAELLLILIYLIMDMVIPLVLGKLHPVGLEVVVLLMLFLLFPFPVSILCLNLLVQFYVIV
jgi:hypothetical protein